MAFRPPWVSLLLLPLTACSDAAPVAQEVPIEGLDAVQLAMFEQAQASASEVGRTLVGELTGKMGQEGPVAAIDHCRLREPEVLASALDGSSGIRAIGRTSHRLRNSDNTPPAWAASTVATADGKPHAFLAPERGLQVLLPIPIQPTCLVCHGDPEAMSEDLREALNRHYPEDQATGFEPGDLRGWFWVEVAEPASD